MVWRDSAEKAAWSVESWELSVGDLDILLSTLYTPLSTLHTPYRKEGYGND